MINKEILKSIIKEAYHMCQDGLIGSDQSLRKYLEITLKKALHHRVFKEKEVGSSNKIEGIKESKDVLRREKEKQRARYRVRLKKPKAPKPSHETVKAMVEELDLYKAENRYKLNSAQELTDVLNEKDAEDFLPYLYGNPDLMNTSHLDQILNRKDLTHYRRSDAIRILMERANKNTATADQIDRILAENLNGGYDIANMLDGLKNASNFSPAHIDKILTDPKFENRDLFRLASHYDKLLPHQIEHLINRDDSGDLTYRLARNSQVNFSRELKNKLLESGGTRRSLIFGGADKLDADDLTQVLKKENDSLKNPKSHGEAMTAEIIKEVAKHPDFGAPEHWQQLKLMPSDDVKRRAVLFASHKERVPSDFVDHLVSLNSDSINSQLAHQSEIKLNKNQANKIIGRIIQTGSYGTADALLYNHGDAVNDSSIKKMINYKDMSLSDLARILKNKKLPESIKEHITNEGTIDQKTALMENPELSTDKIHRIVVQSNNPQINSYAIANKNIGDDTVDHILKNSELFSEDEKAVLAQQMENNPNIKSHHIDKLLSSVTDPNTMRYVAASLKNHPNTTVDSLHRMDPTVKETSFRGRSLIYSHVKDLIRQSGKAAMSKQELKQLDPKLSDQPEINRIFKNGKATVRDVETARSSEPETKYLTSEGKWSGAQRHNDESQRVFRLDIHPETYNKQAGDDKKLLNDVMNTAQQSGHPVNHDRATVGWARVDTSDPTHWFVNELQTDVGKKLKDDLSRAKKEGKDISDSHMAAAARFADQHKDFYHHMLAHVMEQAHKEGVNQISIHSKGSKNVHLGNEWETPSDTRTEAYEKPTKIGGFKPINYTDIPNPGETHLGSVYSRGVIEKAFIMVQQGLIKSKQGLKYYLKEELNKTLSGGMPLVFDSKRDKKEHITVYRVQNKYGEGPYTSKKHNISEKTSDVLIDRPQPPPSSDTGFSRKERETGNFKGRLFGFESPEHAKKWFGQGGLESLKEDGFHLTPVKAKKVWSSGRQAYFEPHESELNKSDDPIEIPYQDEYEVAQQDGDDLILKEKTTGKLHRYTPDPEHTGMSIIKDDKKYRFVGVEKSVKEILEEVLDKSVPHIKFEGILFSSQTDPSTNIRGLNKENIEKELRIAAQKNRNILKDKGFDLTKEYKKLAIESAGKTIKNASKIVGSTNVVGKPGHPEAINAYVQGDDEHVKAHENMHHQLFQIEQSYGTDAKNWVVNRALKHFHPEDQTRATKFVAAAYKDLPVDSPDFKEELLTNLHSMAFSGSTQSTAAGMELQNPKIGRVVPDIGRVQQGFKAMRDWAKNLKPHHFLRFVKSEAPELISRPISIEPDGEPPTQKDSGLQDKYDFQGVPICIENKAGSTRAWKDSDGNTGETMMFNDYGYIPDTIGKDGDAIDVYIGPFRNSESVYKIYQNKKDSEQLDEFKYFLGFSTEQEAVACYRIHMNDPDRLGRIETLTINEFRQLIGHENS